MSDLLDTLGLLAAFAFIGWGIPLILTMVAP